jgi:hypothetical protein
VNDYELIAHFLTVFFSYEFYITAIEEVRNDMATHSYWREKWPRIVKIIRTRKLLPGQPLALVNHKANQVIDENSDEEAYVWLDLMIRNVEHTNGEVEDYYDFVRRREGLD